MYIDCGYSGISGDLLVSSLAELIGISEMKAFLVKMVSKLVENQNYSLDLNSAVNHGISGTHLIFQIKNLAEEQHISLSNHIEQHSVGIENTDISIIQNSQKFQPVPFKINKIQHTHHTSYAEIKEKLKIALECSDFSVMAQNLAYSIFNHIISAESLIHNIPLDEVSLHELGSIDTILDIVGTIFGFEQLHIFDLDKKPKIFYSPIAVGNGTVQCAHGIMPVPAPATSKILEKAQLQFKFGPESYELATPTGVSILAGLKDLGLLQEGSLPDSFRSMNIGVGIGTLKLKNQANLLRIFHGYLSLDENAHNLSYSIASNDVINNLKKIGNIYDIYELETNIDDVRGEIIGYLIDSLDKVGALDVSVYPTLTKKNRPGYLLRVICNEQDIYILAKMIIEETGSLGVRLSKSKRICLKRDLKKRKMIIEGKEFEIQVKYAYNQQNEILNTKIEYEDLKKISQALGLSILKVENLLKKQLEL